MPNLTTADVVQRHRVSRRTLLRMVDAGDLKPADKFPTKTGGFLFDEAEVERAFAARSTRESVNEQVPA